MGMEALNKLYQDLLALTKDEEAREQAGDNDAVNKAYHRGRKEAFKDSAYWLVHSIGTMMVSDTE